MLEGLPYDVINKVPFTRFYGPLGSNLYLVNKEDEWKAFFDLMMSKKLVACDTETQGFHWFKGKRIVGMSFGWNDTHFYVPVRHEDSCLGGPQPPQLSMDFVREDLQKFFAQEDVTTCWFNYKFDAHFYKVDDIQIFTPFHDASVLWQLFDENAPGALKTIASGWKCTMTGVPYDGLVGPEADEFEKELSKWRGKEATARRTAFRKELVHRANALSKEIEYQGWKKKDIKQYLLDNDPEVKDHPYRNATKEDVHYGYVPIEMMTKYAATDTFLTYKVYEHVTKNLSFGPKLKDLYVNELKLSKALMDAEETGVKIDRPYLESLEKELDKEIVELEKLIKEDLGPINLNSPGQLGFALYSYGCPMTKRTEGGNFSTDAKVLNKLAPKYDVVQKILDLRKSQKLRDTYVRSILEKLTDDDILHCQFNQNVSTGRMCIAEGTLIQTPCNRSVYPNGKPIESIKVGDQVYCYDSEGNLHLRTVKDAVYKGERETVVINWIGQGNKHEGSLVCTPDHRIRLFDGSWIEAEKLKKNDKVMALSSRVKQQYSYLYGRYSSEIREHKFVMGTLWEEGKVTHHIDDNKLNNNISNLEVMSASEHSSNHINVIPKEILRRRAKSLHTEEARKKHRLSIKSGVENPNWKSLDRIFLLRLAAKHKGRIRYMMDDLSCDFSWLSRNLNMAGIDLQKVRALYNKEGTYLSKRVVREASEYGISKMQRILKVGYYRAKDLLTYYNLETNHRVLNVTKGPLVPVYDLEVEEFNNFIAGELCVHNSSSSPNLQNIPGSDDRIRRAFIPPGPEYYYVFADYSQVEVRLTAHYSRDKLLLDAYKKKQDIHTRTMCEMFGYEYDKAMWILENESDPEHKKLKNLRTIAKRINFGIIYGVGAPGLSEQIPRPEQYKDKTQEQWVHICQQYIDQYMDKYLGVKRFVNQSGRDITKTCIGYNYFGRPRRLPWAQAEKLFGKEKFWMVGRAKRQFTNFLIQGTAADLFKVAVVRVWELFKEKAKKSKIVNFVHDEIQMYIHKTELFLLNEIRDLMEDFDFRVPIVADFGWSTVSWGDKKELG